MSETTTTRKRLSEFTNDEALAQVLFDLADRKRRGEAVDLEGAIAANPHYAMELRRLLPMMEALAGLDDSGLDSGATARLGTVGDYQILREIGRGGMGIVYEARQVSLSRRVALKILPFAAALDPRSLARFKQESLAAAQLDHPHIVHVYGVGAERGVHYYAMQYIDGQSLAQVIAELRGPDAPFSREAQPSAVARRVEEVEKSKGSKSDDSPASGRGEPAGGLNGGSSSESSTDDLDATRVFPPFARGGAGGVASRGVIENGKLEEGEDDFDAKNHLCADPRATGCGPGEPVHSPDPKSEIPHPESPPKSPSTLAQRAAGISTDRVGNRREFFRGVARLGIQAAAALDYAHQHGILHRDIKPANLMLDDSGKLWIADFGLARVESDGNLTSTGDLMGTLRYMSPEQALGERGLVDQRTDVYSLGATLYELLSLEPVFPDKDRARLLQKIATETPAPLRGFDPAIPEELETIVAKCLEKDPADRYATAGALADDLTRYLAHEPLKAKRAAWTERLRKWSRRHQLAVVAAAVTISLSTTALAISALWVTHEHGQTVVERTAAKQHQAMLRQNRYVSKINLADAAWKRGDIAAVKQLLSECLPGPGEEDLRAFEWHWLSRTVDCTPPAWRRHSGEVYSARFSHDGRRLATCGQDGARVWSWPAGEQLAHLISHSYDVNDIGFSPDDGLLATASDDGTVKIWDTSDWTEQATLTHEGRVIAAHFSPDGKTLACAERHTGRLSEDGKPVELVRLWNVLTNWKETGLLAGPSGELHALAWSPDGTKIATAGNGMRVWDCATSTVRFSDDGYASCVAFAHERPLLAASASVRTVIYNLETRRAVAALPHGAESVAFARNDRTVLTASRDRFARTWDFTGTGEEVVERAAFRDSAVLWSAAFAPNDQTIVTTSHDGSIKLWDRNRMVDRFHLHKLPGTKWVGVPEFSPDGKGLLYNNDSLRLVDLDTGSVLQSLTAPGEVVVTMALSADGRSLATGDHQGHIDLWDTTQWRRRRLVEGDGEQIDTLAFIPGSKAAFVVATAQRTFVSGLQAGQSLPIPVETLNNARTVSFSPDGRLAALLMRIFVNEPPLQVCDLWSGQRVPVADRSYTSTVFSPDGRQFAAGSLDGVIHLWQTDAWDEPMLLVGHGARVVSVAISPDGRTVASAADDTTVKLWNAATGRELLTFEARLFGFDGLRYSRDGTALAVSGAGGIHYSNPQVIVWRAGGVQRSE